MSFPVRVSITTFNLWREENWENRRTPLTQMLLQLRSDIFLFQELTPNVVAFLDENLTGYKRVHCSNREGWTKESNIYWRTDLFDLVDSGYGDLEIVNYPLRGLYWARLRLLSTDKTIFVSTSHFPWAGCEEELRTGVNQRIECSVRVCEHLRRLVPFDEPAVFGGDLNDDFHPLRILSEECAYLDVFEALDLPPPITHPVRPSSPQEEMRPNRTLDWLLVCLPSNCRVVGAFAKSVRGGSVTVSDHVPVVGIIEIL